MDRLVKDPEELMTCPYDKSHHIMVRRMQWHLIRCRSNHKDAKMATCDFNITHIVPEPELQYHHEHCGDRKQFEYLFYKEESAKTIINKCPLQKASVLVEDTQDNLACSSYNPTEYSQSNNVFRKTDVESFSKIKSFHVEERHRPRELECNDTAGQASHEEDVEEAKKKKVFPNIAENVVSEENTPHEITKLYTKLTLGANKSYNK